MQFKKILESMSSSLRVEIHTAISAQLINLLIFRHRLKYFGQLIRERGRALNTTSGMLFLNVFVVIARFRAQLFKGENHIEIVSALKVKRPVGTLA